MKKLLLTAAIGFTSLLFAPTVAAELTYTPQDRTNWVIKGCSETNYSQYSDGGFDDMKDGDLNTFWHSLYSNQDQHPIGCPHYFVIDRGEGSETSVIDGFGFAKRQQPDASNGDIKQLSVYVLNSIDGLELCKAESRGNAAFTTDQHASLTTFIEGKTPDYTGTFNRVRDMQKATLMQPKAGRYVLVVVNSSYSGSHANCAEFELYNVTSYVEAPDVASARSIYLYSPIRESSNRVFVEANYPYMRTTLNRELTAASEFKIVPVGNGFYLYNVSANMFVKNNTVSNNNKYELTYWPDEAEVFLVNTDVAGRSILRTQSHNCGLHAAESGNNWNIIVYGQNNWYIGDWNKKSEAELAKIPSNFNNAQQLVNAYVQELTALSENLNLGESNFSYNSLETVAKEGENGARVANLFDNNLDTYFHSGWSTDASVVKNENHWFAFNFDNNDNAKEFVLKYESRQNSEVSRALEISVYGSTDKGASWSAEPVAILKDGLGLSSGAVTFTTPEAYNGLKFVVKRAFNNGNSSAPYPYYCFAELALLKMVDTEKFAKLQEYVSSIDMTSSDYAIAAAVIAGSKYDVPIVTGRFIFPSLNGRNIDKGYAVEAGSTIAEALENINLPLDFTFADESVKEQEITDGRDIVINGHWAFPAIEFGRVYRIALRNKGNSCQYFYANTANNCVYTRDGIRSDALTPERLFYFTEAEGSTPQDVRVILHTIAQDGSYGVTCASNDNAKASLSNQPMTFKVVENNWNNSNEEIRNAYVFSLQHLDNARSHMNDISGSLGVWCPAVSSGQDSHHDNGSAFRLHSLTADEINAVAGAPDEVKAAAIANPNVANITALCEYAIQTEVSEIYKTITESSLEGSGTTDLANAVPGYISELTAEVAAVKADIDNGNTGMFEVARHIGALKLVANNPNTFPTVDGVLLVLKSTDTDIRGYLCNSNGNVVTSKSIGIESSDVDITAADYHFTFVTVDGKKYLYNVGADKFMNAFGEQSDCAYAAVRNAGDYTWRFNEVPTPIKNIVRYQSNTAHSFAFAAGLDPTNNESWTDEQAHVGGMTLTDNGTRPVIVSMGATRVTDGNGLFAKFAGNLSNEQVEALRERIANAHAAVMDDEAAIPTGVADETEQIVNHYTVAAVAKITAAETPDHKQYLMENGDRRGFENNKVYTITDEAGLAWALSETGELIQANYDVANADYFNWIATSVEKPVEGEDENNVETQAVDGTHYTFSHTHDNEEVLLTIDGNTTHEIGTAKLGLVTLGGKDYVVKVNSGTATTDICEITFDGNGVDVIFDLQGRRLSAPVKGINIINGKKILVK